MTAALFVVAPRAGALVDRVGERSMAVAGLVLQAVGCLWIAAVAAPDLAYAVMVPPLILAGAGTAMAMPAAQKAVVGAVAPSEVGVASGTFTMMRWLGGVFGIAVAVAVFSGTGGGYASVQDFADGFTPAMLATGILAVAGAATAAALPRRG